MIRFTAYKWPDDMQSRQTQNPFIHPDHILYFTEYPGDETMERSTSIQLKDRFFTVQETSEEIMSLIEKWYKTHGRIT